MRRTALLASATLLAALLPMTTAAGASGADDPDPAPVPVDRFEGEIPFASPPAEGLFTWGGDTDDPPALGLTARADAPEGDKVLTGSYDISGYGGFTHDFAFAEPAHDWSAHRGIRFWWEGRGNGRKIAFEIKDGGANGEASELWTTSFTDDWTGWKQVEIPFTDFTYRTDYQPVGGIDQILGLTETWGYALTLPVGVKGDFAMDGVELYGRADQSLRAAVTTDAAVYPVQEGRAAAVEVTVATTGAAPSTTPSPSPTRPPRPAPPSPARTTPRSPAPSPSRRAPLRHHAHGRRPHDRGQEGRVRRDRPAPADRHRRQTAVRESAGRGRRARTAVSERQVAGEEAGRRSPVADEPRGEGRPDDPGGARRDHRSR